MGTGNSAIERAGAAARPLADRFHAAGHSLYLVGGVVRDHFVDREFADGDLDCTTDARPDQIKAVIDGFADAVWSQGEQFGTIGCRIGSRTFEITTHRADAYEPDSRKPVVAFGERIDDDLARRDFTVNAMAMDLQDGRIVDLFGGRADLDAGVLRTPLDPRISFSEDPLRMLRAARFIAGYGLDPVTELTAAVTAMVDRIDIVSVERITDEVEKLLLLDDPARGFEFLVSTGLWGRVFPELDPTTAARRSRRVSAVERARAERWAAFASVGDIEQLRPLRLSNALRTESRWLLAVATRLAGDPPEDDRRLRALGELVPDGERLERAVDFSASLLWADAADTAPIEALRSRVADLRSREPDFDHPELPLDGEQVMELLGLEPGPEVGRAIGRLRRHRLEQGPLSAAEAAAILLDSET